MASATEVNHESSKEVQNGTHAKEPGAIDTFGGEEEESDDYDEEEADYEEERQIAGDEDDDEAEEEEEGEGEEDNQGKDTLTHLLLGNPSAPVEGDDVDDDEDVEDEDEDEDEEYVEEDVFMAPTTAKKRSIDEVVDEDDSQGSKKVKA